MENRNTEQTAAEQLDWEIGEEGLPPEDDWYTPSCTAGDYGPGNPWDAPGMCISDFI